MIRNDKKVDTDYLKKVLEERYYYENGKLFWKKPFKNLSGEVGYSTNTGYRRVKIKNIGYQVHRLIFFIHHGYFPDVVDHINQDKLDNRIENLRDSGYQGKNVVNSELRSDNSSGYRGVTWHKATQKWMSSVFFKGKRYHLGVFEDKDHAATEYDKKAKELFGDFARLNFPRESTWTS